MDGFQAPADHEDEVDYAASKPGVLVVLGGAIQIFAGATTATQGLQMWLLFVFYTPLLWLLPYFLMPLGLLQMVLGATASRGRDWAAIASCLLTWFVQLIALIWTLWSLQYGFSPLSFLWCFLNFLACMAAPLVIPGALRASKVRRSLYA